MNVAIIPARGGSRRIPGKNIRSFHGKPIIGYSIEAALQSGLFSPGCVWVSTEDPSIGRLAEGYGARWWVRFTELARDEVGTQEVARDVLDWLCANEEPVEHACCIYATVPMLTAEDLKRGYEAMLALPFRKGYAMVEGWYYWGAARSFGRVPLDPAIDARLDVGERWIDINVQADWKRAEEMYAALHREPA